MRRAETDAHPSAPVTTPSAVTPIDTPSPMLHSTVEPPLGPTACMIILFHLARRLASPHLFFFFFEPGAAVLLAAISFACARAFAWSTWVSAIRLPIICIQMCLWRHASTAHERQQCAWVMLVRCVAMCTYAPRAPRAGHRAGPQ